MKKLYDASNSIEAHMILNMLEQAGYSGRIDGEFLQGGIGELPAVGVVRVMVKESDYLDAKAIVDKWDKQQPISDTKGPTKSNQQKSKGSLMFSLVCFLGGVLVTFIYYNTPVESDGVDYNGDGTLDEKWYYVNYLPSETETDRNLDGQVDTVIKFDRKGLLLSSKHDDNFDDIFESEVYYKQGNPIWQKVDTTNDGFSDYRADFKFGVLEKISFINPKSKSIIKTQQYELNKLKSSQIDTDGDGELDTLIEYDSIEEISSTSKIH